MKFTKKACGDKSVWDAPLNGNEFLRITTNNSGQYGLYHCYGLAENGITPLRSDRIATANTLRDCKKAAKEISEPKPPAQMKVVVPDYSHIRIPYKD